MALLKLIWSSINHQAEKENMQIGVGKSGVKIGEYANEQEGSGILGWIEPACKNPRWILWFDSKGDGFLYADRADNGAVLGEPVKVKARGSECL